MIWLWRTNAPRAEDFDIGRTADFVERMSREIAERVAVNNEQIAWLRGEPPEPQPGGIGEGAL